MEYYISLDIFDTELDLSDELINELKKLLANEIINSKIIPFTSLRHTIPYSICLYTLSVLKLLIKHIDKEKLLISLDNNELLFCNSNYKYFVSNNYIIYSFE